MISIRRYIWGESYGIKACGKITVNEKSLLVSYEDLFENDQSLLMRMQIHYLFLTTDDLELVIDVGYRKNLPQNNLNQFQWNYNVPEIHELFDGPNEISRISYIKKNSRLPNFYWRYFF